MSLRNFIIVLVLVGVAALYRRSQLPPVEAPPGVLAPADPEQRELGSDAQISQWGEFRVTPKASYRIRARLLGSESYSGGPEGKLSPMDFLLGWGALSDNDILRKIHLSQGGRYYRWGVDGVPPLPPLVINSHMANTHLIPASSQVLQSLKAMRVGQVIELTGYLVDVTGPGGWHWNSSLTRTDSGAGACELMYVKDAAIISGEK